MASRSEAWVDRARARATWARSTVTSSMRAVGLAVFGSWVAVAGCMVDGSRSVVDPTLAGERGVLIGVAEVGPAGGKFVGKDVGISLSIPPGALEESTTIEIRQLELESVPDGVVADTVFELGPDGTRFKRPVELALRFSDDARVDRESSWLRVVQILPDGTLGRTQFVTYEPEARQVTAKLMHFSSYAVADLNAGEAAFESSEERVDQVDLLVLVDDSRSMVGEQENLARNFPRLAAKLNDAGLDYRVGIISPNLGVGEYTFVDTCETPGGLQGKLQADPQLDGCVPPTDPWIAANGEQTNVPGDDVAAAFSCIAKLGSHGCGFEQTLEAVYRALDPAVNPGFIRNDAALAVLLITDEDDCSARDTRLYDTTDFSLGPANFRCFEYGVQCDGFTADNARDVGRVAAAAPERTACCTRSVATSNACDSSSPRVRSSSRWQRAPPAPRLSWKSKGSELLGAPAPISCPAVVAARVALETRRSPRSDSGPSPRRSGPSAAPLPAFASPTSAPRWTSLATWSFRPTS
jgi:hypothetical protein